MPATPRSAAKYSRVTATTTGLSSRIEIRLGIAISKRTVGKGHQAIPARF